MRNKDVVFVVTVLWLILIGLQIITLEQQTNLRNDIVALHLQAQEVRDLSCSLNSRLEALRHLWFTEEWFWGEDPENLEEVLNR